MEQSEAKIREYTRRIMLSRMRLLCSNGFYGLLLMHLKMHIGTEHRTAWSDGRDGIYFHPDFLERVSDRELDYAMMHILLHMALDHVGRQGSFEKEPYDLASDIVVNSNILRSCEGEEDFISLRGFGGVQPHLAPDGEEGWKYTLEELYDMLCLSGSQGGGSSKKKSKKNQKSDGESQDSQGQDGKERSNGWDAHVEKKAGSGSGSSQAGRDRLMQQEWQGWIQQAAEAMRQRESNHGRGLLPAFVERYLLDLKKPKTDWRTVLEEFIQEEVNDYSFCPPDRRFEDSPFFLPDFNEKDFRVEKILFMIDASGSMSEEAITECYGEVKGAIDQFGGKLEGWLGFFDACVTTPKPFVDEEEFLTIRPKGGGGTSFRIIFEYVREHMMEEPPVSIVILTDGYAPFPAEKEAMGIPVLWIINHKEVTPPWGRVTRI